MLLLAGCTNDATGSALLAQVRQTLAERDAKLSSYHLVVESKDGADVAKHAFFFRSPNKMRALLLEPTPLEFSFDGKRIYRLVPASRELTTIELAPKEPARATMALHAMFAPFVIEGFRSPLMPLKGVSASRHGETVELKVEPGEGVTVTYVLRWPSADFLERRSQTPTGSSVLEVEEEHCDAALKLCVPKRAVERADGAQRLEVTLTTLELNPDIPLEDFTPHAPAGWTQKLQRLE